MVLIYVGIAVGSVLLGVILRASGLNDDAASAVRIAVLFALALGLAVNAYLKYRRRRREWLRNRRTD